MSSNPHYWEVVRASKIKSIAEKEPLWLRVILCLLAILFLIFFLALPLISVFYEALKEGVQVYTNALTHPDALSAIKLTITITLACLIFNTIFGVIAAWLISKFEFRGKNILLTLIDLPFAVSPVISGMIFVLLFGSQGVLGSFLSKYDIKIIYSIPGIILATLFVTFPFVARELIPLMQAQGKEEEEAARVLGASGLQTFFRITLPNIKWGLLYGMILCNARAMGEFGAVSVVSGHIVGETNTIPLHVEALYNEYLSAPAFAVASLLACVAIITLFLKSLLEKTMHSQPK